MKVLIVVEGKYPSYDASSKRIANYKKACQAEENNVEILPVYLNVKSVFLNLLCSPILPFLAFWKVSRRIGQNSVVLIYGFGWVSILLIILAGRLRNKRVAIELNEIPCLPHGSRRYIVLKYLYPFRRLCMTRIVFALANGFVVISDALGDYIGKYKSKNAIICKVPILVDFDQYQKKAKKLNWNSPYMLHTATLNDNKDGIVNVFKAFAKIVSEMGIDLHFYLTSEIGFPKTRKLINQIVSDNKLENNVHFLRELDVDTLLAYQQYCDLVVVNKVYSNANKYNFATKLGEYLALGKPVITSNFGEVSNYLQNNVSCIFADPFDVDDVAASMMKILTDPSFGEKVGNRGREIAKNNFDYRAQSKTINQFLNALCCN